MALSQPALTVINPALTVINPALTVINPALTVINPDLTVIKLAFTVINTVITQLPYTSALYIEPLLMTDRPSTPPRSKSIELPAMALPPATSINKAHTKGRLSGSPQPTARTGLKSSLVKRPLLKSSVFKSSVLSRLSISVLLGLSLVACQPPAEQATNEAAADPTQGSDDKVIITADTVTLTTNHILNIKSKRYQPSLGLKGTMFATNTTTLASPTNASVQEVLVNANQQVKKDTPLFVLKVLANTEGATGEVATDAQAEESNPTVAATKTTPTTPAANEQPPELAKNAPNDPSAPASTAPATPAATVYKVGQLLPFKAPFFGSIEQLNIKVGDHVTAQQPLLKLSNPNDLQFIATLPISAKSQLSIGQNVTFSVTALPDTFTGQISKLVPSSNPQHLLVHVHITQHDEIHNQLKPNMTVLGRVDYGQIEVGTIVPKSGIHNADLTSLLTPPYRAINPIKAEVWIIGQDQRLSRQQIQVIEYDPETQQYLVAGINNDSLICLAPLPTDSEGKKVVVS